MKTFNALFKEYITIGFLSEAKQAKYHLIGRYENKVSNKLLKEREDLVVEADAAFGDFINGASKSYFLSSLPKMDWTGSTFVLPVELK